MQITKDKYQLLKDELDQREKALRKKLGEEFGDAIDQGDGLHDSFLIQDANSKIFENEKRINELKSLLKSAVIIEKNNSQLVHLGSVVEVVDSNSDSKIFEIVDYPINHPVNKQISVNSLIGKKLMGLCVGDEFEIQTRDSLVKYKIVNID